jgi:DNA invertase Pin-like site-specific DNA recombinase
MDYGYARVSTRDQDPQLQLNALAAAGCAPIVKEHASGVAAKRPVLDEVLAQLRPGDQLTVWKLDRLGRSITFLHKTITGLAERGVAFRSLTDHIDTTSSNGKLQLNILASFAEFERDLIRERTLAGKARMKAEGRHTGGPALFGWEADHVTVNQDEAALVQEVADRVLDGEPLGRVVDDLNARDVPRPRRGGRWRVTSLRRVLENPKTEAIVDRHADLIRIISRNQGKGQGQGGGRPAEHLLSGILADGREGCGQPLYAATKTGASGVPQRVYRCHKGSNSGGRHDGCGKTSIAQARADAYAEEMFIAAIVSDDFAQALGRSQAEILAGDATAEELDEWRAEIQDLEQVMPTRFAPPNAKERYAQLRRLVDQATARLMAAPELAQLLDLPRSEDKLRERWASWSISDRRAWLRRLVARIEVNPPTVRRGPATDVESRLVPVWRI